MKKIAIFIMLALMMVTSVCYADFPNRENSVEIDVNYDLDTNVGSWRPIVVDKEKIKYINVKVSFHKVISPYSYQKVPKGGIVFALDDSMPHNATVFIQTNLNTFQCSSSRPYAVRTITKRDGKTWKFVGLEWEDIG